MKTIFRGGRTLLSDNEENESVDCMKYVCCGFFLVLFFGVWRVSFRVCEKWSTRRMTCVEIWHFFKRIILLYFLRM